MLFRSSPEKILKDKEVGRFGKSIIDSIQPGYGQYELDDLHQLTQSNSVAATIANGGSTRHAEANGFFQYNLAVNTSTTNSLLCQFAKEDNGKTIKVTVGGTTIIEYTLNYTGEEEFYKVYFEIPVEVVTANLSTITVKDDTGATRSYTVIPVKFESANTSASARLVGGLYMTTQYSKSANITGVTCDVGTVRNQGNNYSVYVPTTSTTAKYRISIADQYGLLYLNDVLVNDAKMQTIVLSGDSTVVNAKVYAEDHTTVNDYTVTFIKGDAPIIATPVVIMGKPEKTYLHLKN